MIEKFIKNIWCLLLTFLIVTALGLGAVTLSLMLMNIPSTFLFCTSCILLVMTIFVYAFWSYMIFNQMVVLFKEKKLVKKSKNKTK